MPVSSTKCFENFLTFSEKTNSAYKVCAKYSRNGFQKISVWQSPNWAISAELFQAQNMPCKKRFTIIKCSKLIFKHIYQTCIACDGELLKPWGISSNGRARASHARGSGIDARILHVFLRKYFYLHWQNNCSMNGMSQGFVALTSSFSNDKDFYRIRSSLPIISLQFCVRHRVAYKTTLILNFFVRNWKVLSN